MNIMNEIVSWSENMDFMWILNLYSCNESLKFVLATFLNFLYKCGDYIYIYQYDDNIQLFNSHFPWHW